jgi:hypothetical protein
VTVLPEVEAENRRLVLRDGWNVETAARRFGVHHTVVRRVITTGDEVRPRGGTPSILEPFKPYLVERLAQYPELLVLLADILGTSQRVLARKGPRLARVRRLTADLEAAVLHHWAVEATEHERQLHLVLERDDELPF